MKRTTLICLSFFAFTSRIVTAELENTPEQLEFIVPALKTLAVNAILNDPDLLKTVRDNILTGEIKKNETDINSALYNYRSQNIPAMLIEGSLYNRLHVVLQVLTGRVSCIAISSDCKYAFIGSYDERALIRNIKTGELLHTVGKKSDPISVATFSADGTRILTGSCRSASACILSTETGKLLLKLKKHYDYVGSVAFSSNGNLAFTSDSGFDWRKQKTCLWNARTGKLLIKLKGLITQKNSGTFSPDGNLLLIISQDGASRIYNTQTGEMLRTLTESTNPIRVATFSADGKSILTGSRNGTVSIRNTLTGDILITLKGNDSSILSVAFSPDGNFALAGSYDGTVRIWDVRTGEPRHILNGHEALIHTAKISPDGNYAYTGSSDRTIRKWPLVPSFEDVKDVDAILFLLTAALDWQKGQPHICARDDQGYQQLIKEFPILRSNRLFTETSKHVSQSATSSSSSSSSSSDSYRYR